MKALALNRVNTVFYDVFLLKVSVRHSDLRFSFKLKVSFCRDAYYKCAGNKTVNVLFYDLQIVICPGSLTGKPDSHVLLEMKRKSLS